MSFRSWPVGPQFSVRNSRPCALLLTLVSIFKNYAYVLFLSLNFRVTWDLCGARSENSTRLRFLTTSSTVYLRVHGFPAAAAVLPKPHPEFSVWVCLWSFSSVSFIRQPIHVREPQCFMYCHFRICFSTW